MPKNDTESLQDRRTKRGPGRPSTYNEKTAQEITERIGRGETLRAICRDDHMPKWTTVYAWMERDESFRERMARARELGHDAIAEETFEIADEMPPAGPDGKTDSGFVAWQKNRIWARQQMLAKWNPKKYGDKQQIDVSAKVHGELKVVSEFGDE